MYVNALALKQDEMFFENNIKRIKLTFDLYKPGLWSSVLGSNFGVAFFTSIPGSFFTTVPGSCFTSLKI